MIILKPLWSSEGTSISMTLEKRWKRPFSTMVWSDLEGLLEQIHISQKKKKKGLTVLCHLPFKDSITEPDLIMSENMC